MHIIYLFSLLVCCGFIAQCHPDNNDGIEMCSDHCRLNFVMNYNCDVLIVDRNEALILDTLVSILCDQYDCENNHCAAVITHLKVSHTRNDGGTTTLPTKDFYLQLFVPCTQESPLTLTLYNEDEMDHYWEILFREVNGDPIIIGILHLEFWGTFMDGSNLASEIYIPVQIADWDDD